MKSPEVDVCLVISTRMATLAELAGRIGIEGAEGSHSQGEPHILKNRGKHPSTVWKVCSTFPQTAGVDEHLGDLIARLPPAALGSEVLPPDAEKYISIGFFSNAQIPTLTLSERALAIGKAYGASIEISWYSPLDDE
jgi:hypothetical protein